MPIYVYKCIKCDREYEVRQPITAEPHTECPNCKGRVYRTIGITNFITKGSGWHNTDYPKGH